MIRSKDPARNLRDEAEDTLALALDRSPVLVGKTPNEIIYELRVHQIELEVQNEAMKKAQMDLEQSRDRYFDLYDFAQVGYFTLTGEALTAEVNLTGAAMLGMVRRDLIRDRFRRFVSSKVYDQWDHFFIAILKHEEQQTCEDDGVGIPSEEKKYIINHGYGKPTGIGLLLLMEILSITGLSIRKVGVPWNGARFEILASSGKFRKYQVDGK